MKAVFLLLALVLVILASGCTQTESPEKEIVKARTACTLLCKTALQQGKDLSSGPCLDNEGLIEGWVCDVAHSPRTPEDDKPENQCPAFGKTASHFVEVDPDCEFIQTA